MSQREGLAFSSNIESDAAPLNHLIADVLAAAPDTRCFRDPTRGGLASTLNEFAQASGVAMEVDEDAVPVRPDVQAACEMLGYDVLQVANEGKMVAVVPAEQADAALAAMRAARYGENAAIIGRVLPLAESARPAVCVRTGWGSTRILDMLAVGAAAENLLGRNCTAGAMRLDNPEDVQIPSTPNAEAQYYGVRFLKPNDGSFHGSSFFPM